MLSQKELKVKVIISQRRAGRLVVRLLVVTRPLVAERLLVDDLLLREGRVVDLALRRVVDLALRRVVDLALRRVVDLDLRRVVVCLPRGRLVVVALAERLVGRPIGGLPGFLLGGSVSCRRCCGKLASSSAPGGASWACGTSWGCGASPVTTASLSRKGVGSAAGGEGASRRGCKAMGARHREKSHVSSGPQ